MIDVLVMSDGRGYYLSSTMASLERQVLAATPDVGRRVIHDDSGDPAFHQWARCQFPGWELVTTRRRSGFGGAYRNAWEWCARHLDPGGWVFSVEGDFTFNRPIDLRDPIYVLETHPWIAQMALLRQAWNDQEKVAGGVTQCNPLAFTEYDDLEWGHRWREHRLFWTTNPNVHRVALCAGGWPHGDQTEGRFTHRLLQHGLPWDVPPEAVRFGYWGARTSGEWVTHIGLERVGKGY